jgi:hypothetical protein
LCSGTLCEKAEKFDVEFRSLAGSGVSDEVMVTGVSSPRFRQAAANAHTVKNIANALIRFPVRFVVGILYGFLWLSGTSKRPISRE